MITIAFVIISLLILLCNVCSAQDSCISKGSSTVILNPNRVMDSAFQLSGDKWTYVSYEIEQANYSEVHLKYLSGEKWKELSMSDKAGISILNGCIPPKSWVLIECLSLDKPPKIIKQLETIY